MKKKTKKLIFNSKSHQHHHFSYFFNILLKLVFRQFDFALDHLLQRDYGCLQVCHAGFQVAFDLFAIVFAFGKFCVQFIYLLFKRTCCLGGNGNCSMLIVVLVVSALTDNIAESCLSSYLIAVGAP